MKKIYDSKVNHFWDALGLEADEAPIISVIGAGGKTGLIEILSEELSERGICHDIMTTTHMWPMKTGKYGRQLGDIGIDGKVVPLKEEQIRAALAKHRLVLIEADGSKGLPCKAPEAWEPVIRKESTHVFAVIGASCLGEQILDCCHRPERVMKLLNCSGGHRLTLEDLAVLALDKNGFYKNVSENQTYGIILNQVDDEGMYQQVKRLKNLLRNRGMERIWFVRMNP